MNHTNAASPIQTLLSIYVVLLDRLLSWFYADSRVIYEPLPLYIVVLCYADDHATCSLESPAGQRRHPPSGEVGSLLDWAEHC